MGHANWRLIIPLALALGQGAAFAAAPAGAMVKVPGDERKVPAAPETGSQAALEQRLGALAAEHLRTMAADTERRMKGYKDDLGLLASGTFYPNAHSAALKDKGQTMRFNHFRDKGSFYHGYASPRHFTLEPNPMGPTGVVPMSFTLKPGVSPSTALDSFRTGLSLLDCGTSAMLSYYEALRGVLGQEKFDALFAADSLTPLRLWPQIEGGLTISPLFRQVPGSSPFKRGQFMTFTGISGYQLKHINGEGSNYNVICDDAATPGSERFVGLGLPAHGADRDGIRQAFVDEYNLDPVGWDIFTEAVAASIRGSYPPSELTGAESLAAAKTTLAHFKKAGGTSVWQRWELNGERVAALAAASPVQAQLLLAAWHAGS